MTKEKIIETVESLIKWHQEQRGIQDDNENFEGGMYHGASILAYKQTLSMLRQLE